MGSVGVAHVDEHVDVIQDMGVVLDVLKADEADVKGGAAQRLDDAGVAVVLLLVEGVVHHMAAPGPHLAPAVQDCHPLDAIGRGALDVVVQLAELIADALYIVDEIGELEGQFEVAAHRPMRSMGLRRMARRAVTQFSLASRTGSPPSWKVSGKK